MEIISAILCFFVLVGVFIGYWILTGYPKQQARQLQQKFASLGNLKGKTRAQIESVVGKPNIWASIGADYTSCTWNTNRYHIMLQFKGDICEGVTSEITV